LIAFGGRWSPQRRSTTAPQHPGIATAKPPRALEAQAIDALEQHAWEHSRGPVGYGERVRLRRRKLAVARFHVAAAHARHEFARAPAHVEQAGSSPSWARRARHVSFRSFR
jgi:hypothetical protein